MGGRPGETDRSKDRHRAPGRPHEDQLEEAARAWRDFADEVEHVLADADRVARAVVAENHGASSAAFEEYWPRLGGGGGQLQEAADAARLVADVLEGFADAVRVAKRLVLAQLVACAASLAAGPLSAAAQRSGWRSARPSMSCSNGWSQACCPG
ncbi:WXG100-like domain-containing protein [Carbonactinospora thermoautotrophica]